MTSEEAIVYLKGYNHDNEVRQAIDVVLKSLERKDKIAHEICNIIFEETIEDEDWENLINGLETKIEDGKLKSIISFYALKLVFMGGFKNDDKGEKENE